MNILNQFTLRTLKKNKVRTLITIIGIILSMAMFTAVTTIIVSIQRYMVDLTISSQGAWHGMADGITYEEADEIKDSREVKKYTLLSAIGYAKLEGCKNPDKPYLFISGIQENAKELIALNLTEGRMPKNSSEIILPLHLKNNGGISYEIGDTFTAEVGKRTDNGNVIGYQYTSFLSEGDGVKEEITDSKSRTYTVVGICDRPSIEPYTAPGYMAFTMDDGVQAERYSVYFIMKKAKDIYEYLDGNFPDSYRSTHDEVLRYMGLFSNSSINSMLYSMAAILMLIIMFGSVSLIYNAFSISISERTKQFGLLKSMGATKKQMRQSVIFEAGVLCLVGIPLGILAGIGGIGVTLYFVNDLFMSIVRTAEGVSLHVVVSPVAILVAVIAGIFTVLVSAVIPAARAVKMPPIQAIMQSGDIKIKGKKVKSSWLAYRLFGFEGMIANKNFKRNRKKYRATVLSLFMSIVLFISASTFTLYLTKSFDSIYNETTYDIRWSMQYEEGQASGDYGEIRSQIQEIPSVNNTSYVATAYGATKLPLDVVEEDYLELVEGRCPERIDRENNEMGIGIKFAYVDDISYKAYLEENNLPTALYLGKNAKALVWDDVREWTSDGRLQTYSIFKKQVTSDRAYVVKAVGDSSENYSYEGIDDWDTMEPVYYNVNLREDKAFSADEACVELDYGIGGISKAKLPWFIDTWMYQDEMLVVLPYSAAEIYTEPMEGMDRLTYKVQADNHRDAYTAIAEYFSEGDFADYVPGSIVDDGEQKDGEKALVMIISVFSYGFITLMSLIAIANVFNTISTNIMLRRREFAMLKSVGMTRKGFKKMMNYECLLYGLKSLLYGLTVSFGVVILIYKTAGIGWDVDFFIPWKSTGIAVVSVFAVVFATMLYAMYKIKDENTMDALRNENL